MRAEIPLLVAHAVLLAWLVQEGMLSDAYSSQWAGEPLRQMTHQTVAQEPDEHLPLLGMDGFEGDEAEACRRLTGFLSTATLKLQTVGTEPPLQPHQIPARLQGSHCSIHDPSTTSLLEAMNVAWKTAELPPVGPLGQP